MEFVGRARLLWQRVEAEHRVVRPEQDRLIDSLRTLRTRNGFRPKAAIEPTLDAFANGWRAMPATGRLALRLTASDQQLTLAEVRVVPSRMKMEGWEESELALSLRIIQIEFRRYRSGNHLRPHVAIKRTPLGDACLHALARRYERGADRSDGAVLADLFALAEAFPEQALTGGDFCIPAGSGAWVGKRVDYDGRPHLAARTYICANASERRVTVCAVAGRLGSDQTIS